MGTDTGRDLNTRDSVSLRQVIQLNISLSLVPFSLLQPYHRSPSLSFPFRIIVIIGPNPHSDNGIKMKDKQRSTRSYDGDERTLSRARAICTDQASLRRNATRGDMTARRELAKGLRLK